MELIRGGHNLRDRHVGCAASIGNFDGVHRGHQAVLAELLAASKRLGCPAVVVTFEPHPREFFAPESAPARLTRMRDKLCAIADLGIERVVCLPFGRRLARMEPEGFIGDLLLRRLGVRFLMVGDDFRFGRQRRGDFAMLCRAAREHGFELARMPTVTESGERISSTLVRIALGNGDMAGAARLIGRPYRISGRVARGDAVGRQLGWRTANIRFNRQKPAVRGIFTVRVTGAGEDVLPGVASVGTRPTVGGRDTLLEVHLFDFDGDLYGRHISVEFVEKLREEERFDTLPALREQIARDVEEARRRLGC